MLREGKAYIAGHWWLKSWRHAETQRTQTWRILGRRSTKRSLAWISNEISSLSLRWIGKKSSSFSKNFLAMSGEHTPSLSDEEEGRFRLHELSTSAPWAARHFVKMDELPSRMARKMGSPKRWHFVVLQIWVWYSVWVSRVDERSKSHHSSKFLFVHFVRAGRKLNP